MQDQTSEKFGFPSAAGRREFFQGFLDQVVKTTHAEIGIAWDCSSHPVQPICQVLADESGNANLPISRELHDKIVNQASSQKDSMVFLRQGDKETNSERPALLFGKIHRNNEVVLVEFVLSAKPDEEQNKKLLAELNRICQEASNSGDPTNQPVEAAPQSVDDSTLDHSFIQPNSEQLSNFTQEIHSDLDYRKTIMTVANETQRLLDCDRVSVVIREGNRFKVQAISGQPSVNRRSKPVKLLSRLATKTIKTRQAFWFPGESDQIPPQIAEPLNEYLDLSATRSIAILPVSREAFREDINPDATPPNMEPLAGLIVEHCKYAWEFAQVQNSIESAHNHAATAIRNSINHKSLFLYPIWRTLGKSKILTSAQNLPKTLAALGLGMLLLLLLLFYPAEFVLHCDGVLLPEQRQKVFAEMDGNVSQIFAVEGASVDVGAPLLELQNEQHLIRLEEVRGQIKGLEARLQTLESMAIAGLNEGSQGTNDESMKALQTQITTLQKTQSILESESDKLQVTSPLQGKIITWNINERLEDRPVQTGQLLMEVADVDGSWEIELNVPDRKLGHLLRALKQAQNTEQQNTEQQNTEDSERVSVTYQLAAEPGHNLTGTIKHVASATQLVNQQNGLKVLVEVDADEIITSRQTRSTVSAKIHCGTRPLGYVWFHEAAEFVQSKILFRIW